MRILGVDPGQRRVGVAVSDDDERIALPVCTLERTSRREVLDRLAEQAASVEAGAIVVGLPLELDGTEGRAARRVRELGADIEARAGVPVVYWDERLTTVTAERALRDAGLDGRRRRERIDRAAATVLLQSYLDSRSEPSPSEPTDAPAPPGPRRPGRRRARGRSRGR